MVFKSKLKNSDGYFRQRSMSSRWPQCPGLDPVVSSNNSCGSSMHRQATTFWLDAVNLLMYVLERAEKLKLPSEVIANAIQTSL